MRKGWSLVAVIGLLTVSIPLLSGATQANSSFEAAVVRPSETTVPMVHTSSGVNLPVGSLPACRGTNSPPYLNVPLNRCVAKGHTLKWILAAAYQVPWDRVDTIIVGGPDWTSTDGFDVEAKAESPSTEAQLHSMLQRFLTREFKLKLRHEKRKMQVLALVVAKGGPKLVAAPRDRNCAANPGACGLRSGISFIGRSQSMDALANGLTAWVGRLVVNKTSLTGLYDFDTGPWRPENPGEDFATEVNAAPDSLPTIFTALQEKLGLRLEAQKADIEVLVIDSAEKPR